MKFNYKDFELIYPKFETNKLFYKELITLEKHSKEHKRNISEKFKVQLRETRWALKTPQCTSGFSILHKPTKSLYSTRCTSFKSTQNRLKFLANFEILIENIRIKRRTTRRNWATKRYIYQGRGFDIEKMGSVFLKPESILRIYNHNKLNRFFGQKYPNTLEKHTGVEIEMISKLNREEMAQILLKSPLKLWQYVDIKSDGSIQVTNDYPNQVELTIGAPEYIIKEVIQEVTSLLKDYVKVNASCGLHVHLDMRQRDVEKSYSNLVKSQKFLFPMQPKSRQNNTFCTKNTDRTFNRNASDRYKAINPVAYRRFRTLEVRLHSGTVDYVKINNWIDFLTKIVDSEPIKRIPKYVDKYGQMIKISKELTDYIKDRIKKFEGDDENAA